jgi:hypothetical protein
MKADVNVPLKSNKQKNFFFVGILSAIDEKGRVRIQICIKMSGIHNTGYRSALSCPPEQSRYGSQTCEILRANVFLQEKTTGPRPLPASTCQVKISHLCLR